MDKAAPIIIMTIALPLAIVCAALVITGFVLAAYADFVLSLWEE